MNAASARANWQYIYYQAYHLVLRREKLEIFLLGKYRKRATPREQVPYMKYVICASSSFPGEKFLLSLCSSFLSPSRVIKTGNSDYSHSVDLFIADPFAVGQAPKGGIHLVCLSLWKTVI